MSRVVASTPSRLPMPSKAAVETLLIYKSPDHLLALLSRPTHHLTLQRRVPCLISARHPVSGSSPPLLFRSRPKFEQKVAKNLRQKTTIVVSGRFSEIPAYFTRRRRRRPTPGVLRAFAVR